MAVLLFSIVGGIVGAAVAGTWWASHVLFGLAMATPVDDLSACTVLGVVIGGVVGFVGEIIFG